jgi:restriction endonuclease S subunit
LLEGLEAVEVNLSFVTSESIDFRIESEFFKKDYRVLKEKLLSKPNEKLLFFLKQPVQTGHTPSMQNKNFYGGKIKFVKTDNLRDNFIKPFFNHYLSEEGNDEIKRTYLKEQDIITTIIGATHDVIARSCIINKDLLPANINQNIALIRVDKTKISPEFLNIYLNTCFGKKYLHYLSRQMEQVNLNCREVEQVIVPLLSKEFQLLIEAKVIKGHSDLEESKKLYNQAESFLLSSISLNGFELSTDPVNVKSFKGSFLLTGRLDAEYYQKKYDDLENVIRTQKHKRIGEIRTDNFRGLQPIYIENGDLDVINSKHILETSLDYEGFEKTSKDYWDIQNRARVFKGDILTYTTGANIGRTQVYQLDKKALASNHVNIIRLKEENPFYVGFVLNSLVGRLQTEKRSAGSAQAELYPKDLDEFLIPIIDFKKQEKITTLIEESFSLKKQSEQLLEKAKRAVEIAIEQTEQKAFSYLNSLTQN